MSTDRLDIENEKRELFGEIRESDGDFSGKNAIDVFMYAVIFGKFIEHKSTPLKSVDAYVNFRNVPSDYWTILRSIAISEHNDLNLLVDDNNVAKVVEKYANAGIKPLYDFYFENEFTFIQRIELLLMDAFEELGYDKDQ